MLKQLKIIFLICISGILCMSVGASIGGNYSKRTELAIGLFTGAHSAVPTYAFINFSGEHVTGAQVVTEQRFMYVAMGHWPQFNVNPNKENLFERNNVDSCFLIVNEYDKIDGYYCKPFYELWKIRFYESPYQFDQRGWSQGRIKPSLYQAEFLQKHYGVTNVLTEYFYGDSLFKLLRDVQDQTWINTYKFVSAKDSITTKP